MPHKTQAFACVLHHCTPMVPQASWWKAGNPVPLSGHPIPASPQTEQPPCTTRGLSLRTGSRPWAAYRWHQVTMMMRPPGAATLASSPTNWGFSGMCSPLSRDHTRSKDLSAKGWCRASATCAYTEARCAHRFRALDMLGSSDCAKASMDPRWTSTADGLQLRASLHIPCPFHQADHSHWIAQQRHLCGQVRQEWSQSSRSHFP